MYIHRPMISYMFSRSDIVESQMQQRNDWLYKYVFSLDLNALSESAASVISDVRPFHTAGRACCSASQSSFDGFIGDKGLIIVSYAYHGVQCIVSNQQSLLYYCTLSHESVNGDSSRDSRPSRKSRVNSRACNNNNNVINAETCAPGEWRAYCEIIKQ